MLADFCFFVRDETETMEASKRKRDDNLIPQKATTYEGFSVFYFRSQPYRLFERFYKPFFLGLPNPQNCFVFCFKVDLDLAEIQNHVLLKNASKNGITETIARFRAGKTGM